MSAALCEPLTVRDPMAISRILIVDDNKMFRSALRAELELHSGWHVGFCRRKDIKVVAIATSSDEGCAERCSRRVVQIIEHRAA